MKTKELNNRIDEFFKSRGFRKIKSPGFVFVKSNGIKTIYFILKTKAIPAFNQFYIFPTETSIIFDEVARVAALKPKNNRKKDVNRGYGMTMQTFHNIKMGGGFHKLEQPNKQIKTIPYSLEELDKALSQIYESDLLEVVNSIPSLDIINNYLKRIPFDWHILRNTVYGNLYIFKLLVLFFSEDSSYSSYKEELIVQAERFVRQETDSSEIEYLKKELKYIRAIIKQLEKEKTISNKS